MTILPYGSYSCFPSKEIPVISLKHLLCGLRREYGIHFLQFTSKAKFLVFCHDVDIQPVCLAPSNFDIDLSKYTHLAILPDIQGNEPVSMTAIAANIVAASGVIGTFGLGASTALFLIDAVAFALTIGLSIGIGALIQAISPTPTSTNPKKAQTVQSNLWNNGKPSNIAGSALPMIFGHPYCNYGVVIASSLTSEDIILNQVSI